MTIESIGKNEPDVQNLPKPINGLYPPMQSLEPTFDECPR